MKKYYGTKRGRLFCGMILAFIASGLFNGFGYQETSVLCSVVGFACMIELRGIRATKPWRP
jgi:hypothetical protein